jgi:hypothetical protein
MTSVELPDGRRVSASYDWSRDWWVARLEGPQGRVAEGRLLHVPLRDLLGLPRDVVSPAWLIDVVDRLAKRDTPLGRRAMCRCCGYLTLTSYGRYDICPVCNWEDDPTTIFEPGERAGPGPNHVSLTEGRRNFAQEGICDPWAKGRTTVRDPLPAERS